MFSLTSSSFVESTTFNPLKIHKICIVHLFITSFKNRTCNQYKNRFVYVDVIASQRWCNFQENVYSVGGGLQYLSAFLFRFCHEEFFLTCKPITIDGQQLITSR